LLIDNFAKLYLIFGPKGVCVSV